VVLSTNDKLVPCDFNVNKRLIVLRISVSIIQFTLVLANINSKHCCPLYLSVICHTAKSL